MSPLIMNGFILKATHNYLTLSFILNTYQLVFINFQIYQEVIGYFYSPAFQKMH